MKTYTEKTADKVKFTRMGSMPGPKGASFRVWAPHAEKIFVIGTFNEWGKTPVLLSKDKDGCWSGVSPDAKAGDEYKYLIHGPDGDSYRIDPYARKVTCSAGNGIIYDTDAFDWGDKKFQMAAGNELVIYEMHIGSFNAKKKGKPGNFDSAAGKFEHLKELGVNAVEVMPVAEFPGAFSWGYDPSHPFAVESVYGGPDALKRFIKTAHDHGIAVIIDVVYNHFGPTDLDLWRFDGWGENNKGGIYFYNDGRSQTPWGETRPDYGRGEVRQYIRDNAIMWLEEYHADGLRWDAISYIRNIEGGDAGSPGNIPDGWSLMQWVNEEIRRLYPGRIVIAEGMHRNPWVTKDTGAGGAGFNAQWDAAFVYNMRRVITPPDDNSRDMGAISGAIQHRYDPDAFKRVIYTESHDADSNGHARLPEEIWPGKADSRFSRKRAALGAVMVFTSPGIPMVFQGQELLEGRWFRDNDPVEWARLEEERGVFDMYRDLAALRRNLSGAVRGLCGQNIHFHHFNNNEKVIAYHRWDKQGPKDSVVVVLNMMDKIREGYVIGFPRAGLWKLRFDGDCAGYGEGFSGHPAHDVEAAADGADGMPCYGKISLGPYTALIYSQEE